MNDSQRVEALRQRPELVIDGVNYGRVIAAESYDLGRRAYIKNLAKCLLFSFTADIPENVEWENTFIYTLNFAKRRDYDEIKDNFLKICSEFSCVNVNRRKNYLGIIPKGFAVLGRYFRYLLSGTPAPFMTAVLVTEYRPLQKLMKKLVDWDKIKLFGDFCDAHTCDTVLTQMAANAGAKTFTLQHGQYRILSEGYENADCEVYKNFISDRLLAWGEATGREFAKVGIDSARVVPVGALKGFSDNKRLPEKEDTGVFGVIMCGEICESTNFAMIKAANEIAQRTGMKYFVRFHPRNPVDKYLALADKDALADYSSRIENVTYAEKVDFSIVHMTGVFVEMLSINSPIFIYDDEYLEDVFRLKPYCFSDADSFMSAYEALAINRRKFLDEQYGYYRYFNNADNIEEKYRNAVAQLREETK